MSSEEEETQERVCPGSKVKKISYLYNRPVSIAVRFPTELIKGVESPSSHGPEGWPLQRALGMVLHAFHGCRGSYFKVC